MAALKKSPMWRPKSASDDAAPTATTPFHCSERQGVHESHIQRHVKERDESRAQPERQRQRSLRVFDFLGHVARRIPAAVCEHHKNQRNGELRAQARTRSPRRRHLEMRPVSMADGKRRYQEHRDHAKFESGQKILQPRRQRQSEDIDRCKKEDHADAHPFGIPTVQPAQMWVLSGICGKRREVMSQIF
jgi:hypothetical protein